jgi:hypothetical protein
MSKEHADQKNGKHFTGSLTSAKGLTDYGSKVKNGNRIKKKNKGKIRKMRNKY